MKFSIKMLVIIKAFLIIASSFLILLIGFSSIISHEKELFVLKSTMYIIVYVLIAFVLYILYFLSRDFAETWLGLYIKRQSIALQVCSIFVVALSMLFVVYIEVMVILNISLAW